MQQGNLLSRPFHVKELASDGYFTGYASVFGAVDQQAERVMRGAFSRSLQRLQKEGRTPAMLWMHDPSRPIGVWTDLSEDATGLAVEGRLALKTQAGAEAYELLRLGALTGLSIGYRTVKSEIEQNSRTRKLTDIELYEISLVTFPANEQARVSTVKSPAVATGTADHDVRAIVSRLRGVARVLTPTSNLYRSKA